MPEFLAPGVFVEETSFRSKIIEGVSTTTTGMIGPAASGPVDLPGPLLTSLGEFEQTYGPGNQLDFGTSGGTLTNYLWHAARAFFFEGGQRLYVVRTYRRPDNPTSDQTYNSSAITEVEATGVNDGHARATLAQALSTPPAAAVPFQIRARYPGAYGNFTVAFTLTAGQNVLGSNNGQTTVGALLDLDVVVIYQDAISPGTPPAFYQAHQDPQTGAW
jgi:hypothetical protein